MAASLCARYTNCTHQRIVDELCHNGTMECHMIAIMYNYDIITTCKSSSCKDTRMYTARSFNLAITRLTSLEEPAKVFAWS